MRIKFVKNKEKEDDVQTFLVYDDEEKEFEYHLLVKELYENKSLEPPLFCGEFTDEEKELMREFVEQINQIESD